MSVRGEQCSLNLSNQQYFRKRELASIRLLSFQPGFSRLKRLDILTSLYSRLCLIPLPKGFRSLYPSTFAELRTEHSAAIEVILRCGHQPAGVGQFATAAGPALPTSTIEQWIDASDVYVLILGRNYGDLDAETDKSYVHREYDYAVAQGKPVIALLMAESILEDRSEQPDQVSVAEDLDHLNRLRRQTRNPHYWTEANDIQEILIARLF